MLIVMSSKSNITSNKSYVIPRDFSYLFIFDHRLFTWLLYVDYIVTLSLELSSCIVPTCLLSTTIFFIVWLVCVINISIDVIFRHYFFFRYIAETNLMKWSHIFLCITLLSIINKMKKYSSCRLTKIARF